MTGKKFKELVARIPDDTEVVHLWGGGLAMATGLRFAPCLFFQTGNFKRH